jgi:predicted MFS family arabinose efflux permease
VAFRAVSMAAYYGVTQGLTSVVGVLAALIAMEVFGWSAQQTFWLIVGCALVEVPWLMLMVPESLPAAKRVPFDKAK